jgi:hypothetical protein
MDSCIPESGYLGLAYASSESSIDRVKHHYFLCPEIASIWTCLTVRSCEVAIPNNAMHVYGLSDLDIHHCGEVTGDSKRPSELRKKGRLIIDTLARAADVVC